jgi:hypothetical protein
MTWDTFGFSGTGGGYLTVDSIRVNEEVISIDYLNFQLQTIYPIYPGSLKVYVNGVNQSPELDFQENSEGKSFSWVSEEVVTANDHVVVDYIIA